jgi:hypothetical protein
VNLIEKQHGIAVTHGPMLFRLGYGITNILDACHDRRQRDEMGFSSRGDHPCKRRFPGPGRPPEDHRVGSSLLDSPHQWLTIFEQVSLTGKLAKRGWPHAVG